MNIKRSHWQSCIEEAWIDRSIIWLAGVRRAGKTYLCQNIPNITYFDCELPRTRMLLEDPETFLENQHSGRIALDEIHRLKNPSELLKIAADHYPNIKIIATGSSTLGASSKFGDTLSGRKSEIWLTPMLFDETKLFDHHNLQHRFLYGGLPPFFMSNTLPEKHFLEWIDSFWAKDIQSLFRLEKRFSFQKFTELVFAQSGSIFEATRFTSPCEVSRTTISNYLSVLEQTFVAHVIRPYSSHKSTEIVSAPKVYGFDTGFVCYTRGWVDLRNEDNGELWEHVVLNELQGQLQTKKINYWRDKRGHEIDFIWIKPRSKDPIAIECKWQASKFKPTNLRSFRRHYPEGKSYVVAPDINTTYTKHFDHISVEFVNLNDLIKRLT